jgi:hypothetical protein
MIDEESAALGIALPQIAKAFLGSVPIRTVIGREGEGLAQGLEQGRAIGDGGAVERGQSEPVARQLLAQCRRRRSGGEAHGGVHRMRQKLR